MFVADRLVFTELHKTGGTHIVRLLDQVIGGQKVGKHNRVPPELWGRFIIGSVRNPWDWYVSLWAFGCQGKGSVRRQVTRRFDLAYLRRQLGAEMGSPGLDIGRCARHLAADLSKPSALWGELYRDPSDPTAFRSWLKLMLSPDRRYDMGEGYGFSPIAQRFGLLTYRYIKLFTKLKAELYRDRRLASLDGLTDLWSSTNLVNFIVRNEQLEKDLICGLNKAGYDISEENIARIKTAKGDKTNRSDRRPASYYYDEATTNLVADREAFVINNHGYSSPRAST